MAASLDILYEDKHVLVVAKPARMLTASDDTGDETLIATAKAYHQARQAEGKKGYLAPLHFLDRPVSGVVMLALSSKAASRLSEAFRERTIDKVYRAVVEGSPAAQATLEDWLLKDHDANVTTVTERGAPGAKLSKLSYRCLGRSGGRALLEVKPETGRSHQIRVQLSARGLPIYGDRKYGASQAWDGQIALHALRVTFAHPVTKVETTVTAPLPRSWSAIWGGDLDV